MSAPVYRIGEQIVRVCWDGWMYELPNPTAHNYEGRSLGSDERAKIQEAINAGTAKKI